MREIRRASLILPGFAFHNLSAETVIQFDWPILLLVLSSLYATGNERSTLHLATLARAFGHWLLIGP